MKIIFRVDASNEIGAGHVVRCKALATNLNERGHNCEFICAELKGNHISLLREEGFKVNVIPFVLKFNQSTYNTLLT